MRALPPPQAPLLELLAPCRRPPPAADGALRTLVANHVEAMLELDECARRQAALALWIEAVSQPGSDACGWWERIGGKCG